jgi:hypothetical protein
MSGGPTRLLVDIKLINFIGIIDEKPVGQNRSKIPR